MRVPNKTNCFYLTLVMGIFAAISALTVWHDCTIICNLLDVLSSMGNFILAIFTLGSIYIASKSYFDEKRESRKLRAEALYNKYTDHILRLFKNLSQAKSKLRLTCPSVDAYGRRTTTEYHGDAVLNKISEIVDLLISVSSADSHLSDVDCDEMELFNDLESDYFNWHDQNLQDEFGEDLQKRIEKARAILLLKEYGFNKEMWERYHALNDEEIEMAVVKRVIETHPDTLNRYTSCCVALSEMIGNALRHETTAGIKRETTRILSKTFFSNADIRILRLLSVVYKKFEILI